MGFPSRYHWMLSAAATSRVVGCDPSVHPVIGPVTDRLLLSTAADTRTVSMVAHPPPELVTVSMYSVVTAGVATGFEIVGSLRPVVGLQLYLHDGLPGIPSCTGAFWQDSISGPALDITVR